VLPFADTRVIGRLVDRVLFVVKEGGPSLNTITEAIESLNDIKLLGLVYNKATTESLRGGYHYYYYDYEFKPRHLDASETKKKIRWFPRIFRIKDSS
jgi:Mrp family chromosome partitioning ATPase